MLDKHACKKYVRTFMDFQILKIRLAGYKLCWQEEEVMNFSVRSDRHNCNVDCGIIMDEYILNRPAG